MFGRGKEGQLGREDSMESSAGYRTTPMKVDSLSKKVIMVACGGEHTTALLE